MADIRSPIRRLPSLFWRKLRVFDLEASEILSRNNDSIFLSMPHRLRRQRAHQFFEVVAGVASNCEPSPLHDFLGADDGGEIVHRVF